MVAVNVVDENTVWEESLLWRSSVWVFMKLIAFLIIRRLIFRWFLLLNSFKARSNLGRITSSVIRASSTSYWRPWFSKWLWERHSCPIRTERMEYEWEHEDLYRFINSVWENPQIFTTNSLGIGPRGFLWQTNLAINIKGLTKIGETLTKAPRFLPRRIIPSGRG